MRAPALGDGGRFARFRPLFHHLFRQLSPLLAGVMVAAGPLAWPVHAQVPDRPIPSTNYHAAFYEFYDGDYKDALRGFDDALRRDSIKIGQVRWIDSICYRTMVGECYYHLGLLDQAMEHYQAALELYVAYPDWMMRLTNFSPSIRPAQVPTFRQVPWGGSNRNSIPGHFPTTVLIGLGQIDNMGVYRRGGIVQQAHYRSIEAQEIVRCTTLAIRRWMEILGPLSQHHPLTGQLIAALSRSPGPPNHWSQAWVDVQRGLALVAGGKATEALPVLTRSIVAQGQYDHPLTSTALLELGRLALLRGDYDNASKFFHEASVAAFYFFDGGILEEAFRYGALTHILANRKGVFPPLEPAAHWARAEDLRRLQVSLLLSAAENLIVLGRTREAAATLDDARLAVGRRPMMAGRIGARLNYLTATAFFQRRNLADLAAGDEALANAMSYMQHGSHWLYQIRYLEGLSAKGQINMRGPITPRKAMDLYAELLRDPQRLDWGLWPMDCLAVLKTPHSDALDHWFLLAWQRNDHEAALEIADRARRHRFFSSLAYGGRLQSLRWTLEAPDEALGQQAKLDRQNLLAQYPAYAERSRQARQLRAALKDMPLAPEDNDSLGRLREQLKQLGAVSVEQEAMLREMAVRREPADLIFPPLRSLKEIREALPDGQVLLAFFSAERELYGFLINRDEYSPWRVEGGPLLGKELMGLLRAMGHFDQNRELSVKDLADPTWKDAAQRLLGRILKGSRADFTANFPELVIVPDGIMWYVPFETLLVDVDGQVRPLISRFRIRYAPTVSLAVPDKRGRNPTAQTAVVVGRLYPRDDDSVAQTAFEDLARVVPRCVALGKSPLPAPSSLYASLMDQLLVLDDLQLEDQGPYGWAPIPIDRAKPGNTLSDWLALPWNGPDTVIFPGYHTAAENSLKGVGRTAPGAEMFLAVCGLLSSGSRTVLLSRWRSGGQTSYDVVREFAQELPHTAPADAWQRAVLVVADSRLDLEAEPRIQRTAIADPPKATHPFFWAGYMLVDSGMLPEKPEKEEPKPKPAVVEFGEPDKQETQKVQDPQPEKPQPKEPQKEQPKP